MCVGGTASCVRAEKPLELLCGREAWIKINTQWINCLKRALRGRTVGLSCGFHGNLKADIVQVRTLRLMIEIFLFFLMVIVQVIERRFKRKLYVVAATNSQLVAKY